jgi:hypothetical protein
MLLLLQQTAERILVTVVVLRVVCVLGYCFLLLLLLANHLAPQPFRRHRLGALEGQSQGAVPVELPESTHGATDTKEDRVVRKLPQLHNPYC